MSTKVGEPKPDAGGHWTTRLVKRDRRLVGEIRSYRARKLTIYWAHRSTGDFQRVDESWMIEADTLSVVRAYGISHVGVLVEDGTRLLAPIALFGPAGIEGGVKIQKATLSHPQRWRIPERLWSVRKPPEDLRAEALIGRMHIAGRRR
jgi:hypothetical protein